MLITRRPDPTGRPSTSFLVSCIWCLLGAKHEGSSLWSPPKKKLIKISPNRAQGRCATSGWRSVHIEIFFIFFLHSGRHNHTNKTSKIDWKLKYAAENLFRLFWEGRGKNIPSKCPTGWHQKSVIPWDTCTSQTGCFQLFRHVWSEGFFFWFQGSWQLRSFMSWFPWLEGNPIFFPPPLVFLVTGMQLASMSLLNVNSRAPQVGREKSDTHTHACTNKTGRCLQVEAKLLHLRHFLLAPITPTTSPPVRQIWQQSNLKKTNPCSKQEDASVSASWKFVSCEEKRV